MPVALAERPAVLAALRERILEKHGASWVVPHRIESGLPAIEAWLGGWPRPGVTEIVGAAGTGRLGLILPSLARLTQRGRPVVVVDAMEQVHPPGWAMAFGASGVEGGEGVAEGGCNLEHLWIVRPGLDRAAWAAEQVARSGAVEAVVLLDAPRLGRSAVRLARAAEQGGSALFVVAEEMEVELPAALRLEVGGYVVPSANALSVGRSPPSEAPYLQAGCIRVRCTRHRDGRAVGERVIPLVAA